MSPYRAFFDEIPNRDTSEFWSFVFKDDPRPIIFNKTVDLKDFTDDTGFVRPHIFIACNLFSHMAISAGVIRKEGVIRVDGCTFIDSLLTLTSRVFECSIAAVYLGKDVGDFFNRQRDKYKDAPGFYNTAVDVINSIEISDQNNIFRQRLPCPIQPKI